MGKVVLECEDCNARVEVEPLGDWTPTCKVCGGARRPNHDWSGPDGL